MALTYLLHSPKEISLDLEQKVRKVRLRKGFSRRTLAERSGVSGGTIKRFENTGEVSLTHLILMALPLGLLSELSQLFDDVPFDSIHELKNDNRQRGR